VGVEERPAPRWKNEVLMRDPEKHGTEGADESPPRTEAVGHAIGVAARVGSQFLKQRQDREGASIGSALDRHEPGILGVQKEHDTKESRENATMHVVPIGDGSVGNGRIAIAMSRILEAIEEEVRSFEHLPGQALGHATLPSSAVFEEARQRPLGRDTKESMRREKHHERIENRAPTHAEHLVEAESQMPCRFAWRPIDQPERAAVREKSDRDSRVSEETIELRRGWIMEGAGLYLRPVEVQPVRQLPNEDKMVPW